MIRFENVSKKFTDDTVAVDSVDFEIRQGEFFVMIGPSGCGKTTTLKMINRLIPLSDGTLYINGKKISEYDIHELRWNIGYVLQQIALFPHMTIEENIAIVPELKSGGKIKFKKEFMSFWKWSALTLPYMLVENQASFQADNSKELVSSGLLLPIQKLF